MRLTAADVCAMNVQQSHKAALQVNVVFVAEETARQARRRRRQQPGPSLACSSQQAAQHETQYHLVKALQ